MLQRHLYAMCNSAITAKPDFTLTIDTATLQHTNDIADALLHISYLRYYAHPNIQTAILMLVNINYTLIDELITKIHKTTSTTNSTNYTFYDTMLSIIAIIAILKSKEPDELFTLLPPITIHEILNSATATIINSKNILKGIKEVILQYIMVRAIQNNLNDNVNIL